MNIHEFQRFLNICISKYDRSIWMTKWRNSQKCILQPAVSAWSSRLPKAVFKLDFLFSLCKPLIPSLSSRLLMIHYPTALHGHNSYKLLLYSHINISCFSLPTLHIWNERRILIFFWYFISYTTCQLDKDIHYNIFHSIQNCDCD